MCGAPGAYTEAGPPERIMADGFIAASASALMSQGTISEYTCKSRTRRAMSWPYCAPKSNTATNCEGRDAKGAGADAVLGVDAASNTSCAAGEVNESFDMNILSLAVR